MYEPSRHMATYHIAGFQHWSGALVLSDLKPGMELRLTPEPKNPYDPEAIAIYYEKTKLGYVPASQNSLVSLMSFYGYAEAFELRILQIDPEADPWNQVRVGLYVKDAR